LRFRRARRAALPHKMAGIVEFLDPIVPDVDNINGLVQVNGQ
jgi:hypothetical protein